MPTFSQVSRDRLSTCHSDLVILAGSLIVDYDITVVCGHRSRESQHIAYTSGHSGVDWPDSKHNEYPSLAVDLAPFVNGGIPWDDTSAFYLLAGKVLERAKHLYMTGAMQYKLRGGADWDGDQATDDQALRDPGHFELVIP